jgi:hypothetical protein
VGATDCVQAEKQHHLLCQLIQSKFPFKRVILYYIHLTFDHQNANMNSLGPGPWRSETIKHIPPTQKQ